jgi:hypothetical protein
MSGVFLSYPRLQQKFQKWIWWNQKYCLHLYSKSTVMDVDVKNFENFTLEEYVNNLIRLNVNNHESLVGSVVYYSKKSYGKHTIVSWDENRGEFLLDLDGDKFWSNPFRIHLCTD